MGWLCSNRRPGQSPLTWLQDEWAEIFRKVDSNAYYYQRGRYDEDVVYIVLPLTGPDDIATASRYYEPCADGIYRTMIVVLLRSAGAETCRKDMDEHSGPAEDGCPVRLLDMLSPLKEGVETYARAWREKCRAAAATKAAATTEAAKPHYVLTATPYSERDGIVSMMISLMVNGPQKRVEAKNVKELAAHMDAWEAEMKATGKPWYLSCHAALRGARKPNGFDAATSRGGALVRYVNPEAAKVADVYAL